MPFVKKGQITNQRLELVGRKIIFFYYRNWHHTKTPLVIGIYSDSKYIEGINVKYLSPNTATKIREYLTEMSKDGRRTPKSLLNYLKTKHPIAYGRGYRKYFLKFVVPLHIFEIPLIEEDKKKFNKEAKKRPDIHPSKSGKVHPDLKMP
jgi:hypothetical protein